MKNTTSSQIFLIHYGEIGLKGKNRSDFERKLRKNILYRLKNVISESSAPPQVKILQKYLTLTVPDKTNIAKVTAVLKKTYGIQWFAHTQTLPRASEIDQITKKLVLQANSNPKPNGSFKVSCKRADKTFPLKSPEIEKLIGRKIIANTKHSKVNLTKPDQEYFIEITPDQIYLFNQKIKGPGGLPVGSSGRVLVLLSGGLDSPVAANLMAKRGCNIDFLHFHVNIPQENSKMLRLVKKIQEYTDNGRLFLSSYLPFNMALVDIKTNYELVLFRRFVFRIAQKVCTKNNIHAIVTGDNLGQVASQTLENITASNDVLQNLVCYRPLIGFDKVEIITIAKEIGTYEISNEPGKDCCSIIDRHAKTRVSIEKIEQEENKIDNYEGLIKETLNEIYVLPTTNHNYPKIV
ncbi:MAG: tRNA uracil 4-sulfurtransferase ThiI [Patescibacteria group bacterium]|nr:tRNA uracil 4-sulfurtransferase ThiI [Patescibacteria group bacterium]